MIEKNFYLDDFFENNTLVPYDNCGDGCSFFMLEHCSQESVKNWKDRLLSEGYELCAERFLHGNYFAAAAKDGLLLTAYFTPCDNTLRVTAGSSSAFPAERRTACSGETVFYVFENDHSLIDCGMCLIIQCPDYSFFLVDSGHYFQFNDNDRIYRFMRERTPEGQKVVVNGWYISHGHSDHISKLMDFLRYNTDDVIIEAFYSNVLPEDYPNNNWGSEEIGLSAKLRRMLDGFSDIPKYKLHSGMKFNVRNLSFDVLCTYEDIFPDFIDDYNDSSCVLMLNVEGTRVFIPGDASAKASRVLENRYGENLKCDIVQISHHGHTGLSGRCYEMLGADLAVFPITRIKFDEEYPRIEANRRAIEIARKYFISSDGTVEIHLPYDIDKVRTLPDESFEDFEKIRCLWGYTYSEERKKELFEIFLNNGGSLEKQCFPVDYRGSHQM